MRSSSLQIAATFLPNPEQSLFLGVSGGLDSIALLQTCLEHNLQPKVLHVNYRLRGEEADLDEAFVRSICVKNNIEFLSYRISDEQLLHLKNGNLQGKARAIRYSFFETQMKLQPSILMTAHHQDDQVETFFIRLFRKSGLKGLQAIRSKNGNLYRPFLGYSKAEIKQVATAKKWTWREDASNQSTNYLRNKIRLEYLPLMEKERPELRQSVLIMIDLFQQRQKLLEEKFENILYEIQKKECIPADLIEKLDKDEFHWLADQLGLKPHEINQILSANSALNSSRILSQKLGTLLKTRNGWTWKKGIGQTPQLLLSTVDVLPKDFTKEVCYFDAHLIQGPLFVRQHQTGDRIDSIGVKGSQLISKISKDAKLEIFEKKNIWLVCDEKRILWVYGLKVSRHALATQKSTQILKVELKFED